MPDPTGPASVRATLGALRGTPAPTHERRPCDRCGDVRLVGLPPEGRPDTFICVACGGGDPPDPDAPDPRP